MTDGDNECDVVELDAVVVCVGADGMGSRGESDGFYGERGFERSVGGDGGGVIGIWSFKSRQFSKCGPMIFGTGSNEFGS